MTHSERVSAHVARIKKEVILTDEQSSMLDTIAGTVKAYEELPYDGVARVTEDGRVVHIALETYALVVIDLLKVMEMYWGLGA